MKRLIALDHTRTFSVVLEPEEKGGFTVRVPSLPEIVTYGKGEREALAMAEEAIRLVPEDCAARGEPVPAGEPPRIREVTVTWPHEPAASFPQSQRGHSPPGARGLCRIANLR
jgi:antitoxin HicB